ncbi:glucose-1-phosphate thymidylyltransferase RfbA [uncultured Fusobacterium sp.]|uniref:glucose-1-phosphate thymidylyltransferase RfbA n=1 Tax=uncultured Fusobacterium sp. TaxID=159267 RepID=UPI0025E9A4CA|nr:glucose-1-phosphate thymidylyltransferase RfbA [uncultured Fusobacterium sp.]
MKGIILSGGKGTRLHPLTKVISKQLLPIYNKPMIYYSLSVLMLAGVKDILLISDKENLPLYQKLLGDGKNLGINISYKVQEEARGVAEAFLLGEKFIGKDNCMLILGDNIFYGNGFTGKLKETLLLKEGAMIFPIYNKKPENFGVIELKNDRIISLEEKPKIPKSNYVVPGLYYFDNTVVEKAKNIEKSERGELEIISILNQYLNEDKLFYNNLGRGMVWLDAGTFDGLLEASNLVQTIEKQQGILIGSIEEVAYRNGWISKEKLLELAEPLLKTDYGKYLVEVAKES